MLAFLDIRCQGQSERNARDFQVQQIGCLHGESNFKSSDILAGHILDLIELDGTVSASRNFGDPTIDTADHALSWLVVLRSWKDDDKLMVRIRYPPPNRTRTSQFPFRGCLKTPFTLSLSKGRSWFDKLSTNGSGDLLDTLLEFQASPESESSVLLI